MKNLLRIKSIIEFKEKLYLAESIQKLIKNGTATTQNKTMFLVLNNELKEYIKCNRKILKKHYN